MGAGGVCWMGLRGWVMGWGFRWCVVGCLGDWIVGILRI